ncbi:MAG: hypothetical protein GWP63_05975 [Haliea sp.]|nr:hypothetical protein [Haliea sp.]
MDSFYIEPEIYRKYRDQVIALSQSIQVNYPENLPPEKRKPGLSDEQIAQQLGLDTRTVAEIRCVAEREYYGIDEWQQAIEFKERACRGYAKSGLGFTTRELFRKRNGKKEVE